MNQKLDYQTPSPPPRRGDQLPVWAWVLIVLGTVVILSFVLPHFAPMK